MIIAFPESFVHQSEESVQTLEYPVDLKHLDRLLEVRIEHLDEVLSGGSVLQPSQSSLCLRSHPIDTSRALLHRGWHPRNAIVVDPRAKQVQVLPFLQHFGGD